LNYWTFFWRCKITFFKGHIQPLIDTKLEIDKQQLKQYGQK